jgi:hypothetical protein
MHSSAGLDVRRVELGFGRVAEMALQSADRKDVLRWGEMVRVE